MALVKQLLQTYASLPYHRGKAQVMDSCLNIFGVTVKGDQDVTRQGLRWRLNPEDYPHFMLYWFGVYNRWEVWHLEQLTPPHGTFFDIGANYGYYSLMLTSHLGPGLTTHAFEPNPPTLARLRLHARINDLEKQICCHGVALADKPGRASLTLRGDNSGAAFLSGGESLEVSTLDSFCREHGVERIDSMKIDVEGSEEKLIRGGTESLDRFRPSILIELNPPALRRSGTSVENTVRLLTSLGYELFEVQRGTRRPLRSLPQGDDYTDALCIHKSKL